MQDQKALIGRYGIAKTSLLASGLIEIDEKLYEAQSRIEAIARGDPVVVIDVFMNRLIVEKYVIRRAA